MKLLYATSLSYPAVFANRIQVKATAEALARRLANGFFLGLCTRGSEHIACQTVEMGGGHRSPVLAWRYFRFIRREHITHVYAREERLVFFLRIYAALFRVPLKIFYEAHFVSAELFFHWAIKHSDGVVAITQGIKDELVGWPIPANKILIARDGVDLNRFGSVPNVREARSRLGLPADKKIFVYTGSFTRYGWKGIDVLADAVAYADPSWLFIFIGGTAEEIVALKKQYPSKQILFKERVSGDIVSQFLAAADILVIPNKKGERASEYYTSPLKLFEYMASSVPILASDIASIREVVGDDEVTFFTANDSRALAVAAQMILFDYPAARRKAERAKAKVAAEYSWDTRAQRISDFVVVDRIRQNGVMRRKISSALLLVRAFTRAIIGKRAQLPPKNVQKILIVQMAKLGDMVCSTPLFRAVKENYPDCQVLVLGNAINKSLLENNADIDRYVIYDDQKDIGRFITEIRSWHVDAAFLTSPEYRLLAALFLADIPLIVGPHIINGYSPYESFRYKLLRRVVVTRPHAIGSYAPREYLRLLEPVGISSCNTTKHVDFSKAAEQTVENFMKDHGIFPGKDFVVGISASAGNKIKLWGAERFAAVAEYIHERYGAKVVLIGGPCDREEVEAMINALGGRIPVVNALEAFSLDELKAAIAAMDMLIAVDTGPIYIAEAFTVATIDIVGPMDEREQPPISEIHRVVIWPERKAPVLHIMNARVYDYAEARHQTEAITVDMVTTAFDSLAARLGKTPL